MCAPSIVTLHASQHCTCKQRPLSLMNHRTAVRVATHSVCRIACQGHHLQVHAPLHNMSLWHDLRPSDTASGGVTHLVMSRSGNNGVDVYVIDDVVWSKPPACACRGSQLIYYIARRLTGHFAAAGLAEQLGDGHALTMQACLVLLERCNSQEGVSSTWVRTHPQTLQAAPSHARAERGCHGSGRSYLTRPLSQ